MRPSLAFLFTTLCFGTLGREGARADTWLIVPPFNQSGNGSLDWLGESIAESLTETLAAQGELVIDRESRREGERRLALRPNVSWTLASVVKLAEALDGTQVVYGSFQVVSGVRSAGQLKLRMEVVNVRDFEAAAQLEENGPLEELAAIQGRVSYRVWNAAGKGATMSQATFLESLRPIRLDAMENYVRGLLTGNADVRQKFFEQALKLDARYSQAAFRLGKHLYEQNAFAAAAGWLGKVAKQDSHYREAQFFLGLAQYESGDFRAAMKSWEEVAKEVPLSEVYNNLGLAQFRLKLPEAIDSLRRALEGDDKDPTYHFNLGVALLASGERIRAADEFRAVLDRDSSDQEATKLLGRSLRASANPPVVQFEELAPLGRPRFEFNEAAYRQLKALIPVAKPK